MTCKIRIKLTKKTHWFPPKTESGFPNILDQHGVSFTFFLKASELVLSNTSVVFLTTIIHSAVTLGLLSHYSSSFKTKRVAKIEFRTESEIETTSEF